jgi:hypothetical protein
LFADTERLTASIIVSFPIITIAARQIILKGDAGAIRSIAAEQQAFSAGSSWGIIPISLGYGRILEFWA